MLGTIENIGKTDSKRKDAREKNLKRCEGADLLAKQGVSMVEFSSWSNKPAREWVCARVNELKAGKNIDLRCECQTHDLNQTKFNPNGWLHKMRIEEVKNCSGVKLKELILLSLIS